MIQFNLLPDVKIEYIKTRRVKRLVIMVSIIASSVALFVMISLFSLISVAQKEHLGNLSEDIETSSKEIESIDGISKILTVQNQLLSLDTVHSQKPVASRLGSYIETVTPSNISIATLDINFDEGTMTISGKAEHLVDMNKFLDTLKFTKYKIKDVEGEKNAFSNVVLTAFTKGDINTAYSVSLSFDQIIFNANSEVTLSVPSITTNRSVTERPSPLFQQTPLPQKEEE